MRAQDLEPEMEALYSSLVPDFASQVVGTSEGDLERVEALSGRPLPRFYRWFLLRMGAHMGPFGYPTLDFTARAVLAAHSEHLVRRDSRFLMIGREGGEQGRMGSVERASGKRPGQQRGALLKHEAADLLPGRHGDWISGSRPQDA